MVETANQDGDIGRCTVPSHTTKRRTTNLKTKNNQNCQKIELYGSLTNKELKKKHSSRPVGGADIGSQVERTHGKLAEQAIPHLCADKPRIAPGEQAQPHNTGF